MRLHILSDLHLEFAPFVPAATTADVVVCAGDVHTGKNGLRWLRETFEEVPVVYVLGNHEFYGQKIPKLTDDLKREADGTNVRILENEDITIDGVAFLGATLWTDFALNGNPEMAALHAQMHMTDFRRIRMTPTYRRFRPSDAKRYFASSFDWLLRRTGELTGTKFVVVTHHAPSPQSVPERLKTDALSSAYASNLDAFIESCGAAARVHGHIHSPVNYQIGRTRVVSNPRGYPDERVIGFDPACLITV